MATRIVNNEDGIASPIRTFRINNLTTGDDSDLIYLPNGVRNVRAFGYGTAFSVDILGSPVPNRARHMVLATVTNGVPTVPIPGPTGVSLQVRATQTTGAVDVFLVCEV
jgi:hypothetical protein